MKSKKSSYTVMFVPDGQGKTFFFRLNKAIVYALIFFLVVFVCGILFLLVKTGQIGLKLQYIESLQKDNTQLRTENEKLHEVVGKVNSIEKTSVYLSRIARVVGEQEFVGSLSEALGSGAYEMYTDSLDSIEGDLTTVEPLDYRPRSITSASREELSLSMPNISPVEGWITKRFFRSDTISLESHLGVDFAAKAGTPIRSTAPGIIESVVNDKYFGLLVTVKHKFGFTTRFGHCLQVLVSKGDLVERGQTIALVGSTGRSTAPHVHYEIIKNEKNVDPLKYIFDRID